MASSTSTSSRSAFVAALLLLALQSPDNMTLLPAAVAADCITEQNVCDDVTGSTVYRPLPLCVEYALCTNGEITLMLTCPDGYTFDVAMQACNWEDMTVCSTETCTPTLMPTPTLIPTALPTFAPAIALTSLPSTTMTDIPSFHPSLFPSTSPSSPDYNEMFFQFLESEEVKEGLEWTVFQAHNNPDGIPYPTTRYSYDGLISSLKELANDGITSDGRSFVFYTGKDVRRIDYGVTNLAAFLANAMVESIYYDTCDEFNTDTDIFHFGRYPLSNACGQNQRSYQDEVCTTTTTSDATSSEVDMSCSVDTTMEMESMGFSSGMTGVSTPPPFTCRPKNNASDYVGYWDDKTGETHTMEYSSSINRTDVEGCCWWGRGVLLTRGVCNIGKLNYFLGERAYEERGEGRFPNVDFCSSPDMICANGQGEESAENMKWIVGMFEWIERIQSYTGWDYMINLQNFVDGGSWDDSFIDAVSSIFTQGCHSSYCSSTMEVTKLDTRRENFVKLLEIFSSSETTPPQMSPTGQTQQWEFDPAVPTMQQWNGNSPIELTPTWALDYYGNPPAQTIPTLEGYNPTTQTWNANPPVQLAQSWEENTPSMEGYAQWEFDPAVPTTQQWNGNAPIDLTPTWALDYYGNPPAQIIPTLEGYNPTTQQWDANPPAQLAPSWEEYTPSITTSLQEGGNSYPTTQQGNVPSLQGTSNKDTLIPIEDSSALSSPTAFWMTTLVVIDILDILIRI